MKASQQTVPHSNGTDSAIPAGHRVHDNVPVTEVKNEVSDSVHYSFYDLAVLRTALFEKYLVLSILHCAVCSFCVILIIV